jgi:hypothetical protein
MSLRFPWGGRRVFPGLSGWLLGWGIWAVGQGVLAAVIIPSLFNTGVDDFRRPLAAGAVDPHYRLVEAPGGLVEPVPLQRVADPVPIPTWAAQTETSAWLTPGNPVGANRLPGTFSARTTFHLVGLQPSTAVVSGRWWVDDTVLEVRVNGVVQAGLSGGGFREARPFALTGPFLAGQNVVEFRWVNLGVTPNPTGFRVEWNGVAEPLPGLAPGRVLREVYQNVPGLLVDDLRRAPGFPAQPDRTELRDRLEAPSEEGDYYGQRFSGWLVPPATAEYVFAIDSDDQGELYLSTNDTPGRRELVAREPEWSSPREYVSSLNQVSRGSPPANLSQPIKLVAGRPYWIEALMKENQGGDNLGVTWRRVEDGPLANGAEPIAGAWLVALSAPVIEIPPQDLTVPEGVAARLSVVARGAGPLRYQWRRFGDLPGETNAILHREPIQLIHSGLYQVTVSNPFGEVTSEFVRVVVQPVREVPPNDRLQAPSPLAGESVRVEGSLIRATAEEGDPSPVGGSPNVWWSWQAPDDLGTKPAVVTLAAQGVAFVPVLGVYRRSLAGDWLPVEPERVYRGYGRRELRFRTGAGENFLIGLALGSERTDPVAAVVPQGDFQLELRCARVGFGAPESAPGEILPTLVSFEGEPVGDYPPPAPVAIRGQVGNAGRGGTLPLRVRVLAEPVILDLCDIPDAVPVPEVRQLARLELGVGGLAAGGELGWEANVECPSFQSIPEVPFQSAHLVVASQHWRLRLVLEEQLAEVWQLRDAVTLLDGPRLGTEGCVTGGGVILLGESDRGGVSQELPRGRLFGPAEARVGETVEFRGELVFGRPTGVPLVVNLLSADWAIQPALPGLQIDATGKLQVGDVKGEFEARVSWSKGVDGQVVRVEAPLRVIGVLDPPVLALPLRVGEVFEVQVPAGSVLERSARLDGPWQAVPGTGVIRIGIGNETGFLRLRR